ncbi:30S ribosomal protein S13 [Candidatus Alkanophaga liquidiphilum]|nr:Ribosomal protein S13 [Candidatus Alkanophaga liquidiphilum]RLG38386.1 MAG: 30S ribosomal protein S13 [Candidatus Alkanophagales archaeon]
MAEDAAEGATEEELKHIVRLVDTDLDGRKSVQHALCGIKGVGRRVARAISISAGINPNATMGKLSDEEIERLKTALESVERRLPGWMLNRRKDIYTGEDKHILGADLLMTIREDINFMRKIRCYKGIRHELGQKVRGQRTRSTGRRGPVVGVRRKRR